MDVTAHMFQQFVEKSFDIRLTAVGERLFLVAIHAGSAAARVDWRTDYDALTYEVIGCPDSVVESVARYLESERLAYGAFDLPIASAIADELLKEHQP